MIGITTQTIFTTLADSAVKGCAVGGATLVAAALLRRSTASARHFIWLLGAGFLLMLPLMSRLLPRLDVALPAAIHRSAPHPASVVAGIISEPAPASGPALLPDRAVDYTANLPGDAVLPPLPRPALESAAEPVQNAAGVMRALALIWFVGFGVQIGLVAFGLLAVWRLFRRSERVTDGAALALVQEARAALGVRREVLLISDCFDPHRAPVTWGAWRPVILISQEMLQWPADRLRTVLIHEMAHISRYDWLIEMLARVVQAAYWFHPCAWLVTRGLHAESERACDDRVILSGVEPAQYAGILLETIMAINQSQSRTPAMPGMARPPIERRLRAILSPREKRAGGAVYPLAVGALFLATILPVTALHLAGQNAQKTPPHKAKPSVTPAAQSTADLKMQIAHLRRIMAQNQMENHALRRQLLVLKQQSIQVQRATLAGRKVLLAQDRAQLLLRGQQARLNMQQQEFASALARVDAARAKLDEDKRDYTDQHPRVVADKQALQRAGEELAAAKQAMSADEQQQKAARMNAEAGLQAARQRLQEAGADAAPHNQADIQHLSDMMAKLEADQQRQLRIAEAMADSQRAAEARAQQDSLDTRRKELADLETQRNVLEVDLQSKEQLYRAGNAPGGDVQVAKAKLAGILAEIDLVKQQVNESMQAKAQQDRSAQMRAGAQLEQLKVEVASVEVQLLAAQARAKNLDALAKAGAAKQSDADEARASVLTLQAELEAIQQRMNAAKIGQ